VEGRKKLSSQSCGCDMQDISIFWNCKSRSIVLKVEMTSFRTTRISHIGLTQSSSEHSATEVSRSLTRPKGKGHITLERWSKALRSMKSYMLHSGFLLG
jgi:hypothetical protein